MKQQREVREVPEVVRALDTKSAKIRALAEGGWTAREIIDGLAIRTPQHVYNVLRQRLKTERSPDEQEALSYMKDMVKKCEGIDICDTAEEQAEQDND